MIYVSHCYGGLPENMERCKKVLRKLQLQDLSRCYICPLLSLSHLKYGEIGYKAEMDLCLEILANCDALIIASELSKGVRKEIRFALDVGIPIYTLTDDLRLATAKINRGDLIK